MLARHNDGACLGESATQGAFCGGRHLKAAVEAVVSAPLTSMFIFRGRQSKNPSGRLCLTFLTVGSFQRTLGQRLDAGVRGRSLVSSNAMRS